MWRDADTPDPVFTDTLELDLGHVEPRWPARSARRTACAEGVSQGFLAFKEPSERRPALHRWAWRRRARFRRSACASGRGRNYDLGHGDVVIAAITSCTNTSNPSVLVGAGLLARKARQGPEGQALGEDLARAGLAGGDRLPRQGRPAGRPRRARLQPRRLRLHHLHRQFRPAAGADLEAINENDLVVGGRCCRATATSRAASSADVRANYLASPPLVVAYALAGSMNVDLTEPSRSAGQGRQAGSSRTSGRPRRKSAMIVKCRRDPRDVPKRYADVFKGDEHWQAIAVDAAARPTLGTTARPTCRTRPISRA
jgi:aconitate hydratase